MKCSLCGTELIPGNNICPSCGSLNMTFEQTTPGGNVSGDTSAMVKDDTQTTPVQAASPATSVSIPDDTPEETLEQISNQEELQPVESIEQVQPQEDLPEVIEQFEDLDEGEAEVVNATEDMAVPELAVEQENLTEGARDISSSQNVSTYDPTQEQPQEEEVQNVPREAGVNFALPEVKEAAHDTQGMGIMDIQSSTTTVGDSSTPNTPNGEVVPEQKEKFSLKIFKKKSLPRNLVLILLAVVLIIGVLLGATLFGKQVYTPTSGTKKNTTKIQHVADGKNNITYAGKFIYKIPDVYDFDKENGGVLIYPSTDDYRLFIKAVQGSYQYIANSKESLRKSLDNIKANVSNIKETVLGDHKYVTIEATVGPRNRLYALREGNNDYVFYIEIVNNENGFDHDALQVAEDIINNVEYNDKYTNMEEIKAEDVSEVLITASEAHNNA